MDANDIQISLKMKDKGLLSIGKVTWKSEKTLLKKALDFGSKWWEKWHKALLHLRYYIYIFTGIQLEFSLLI